MRTRFLNIDYFNRFSSVETLNDLNFPSLPVPQITLPSNHLFTESETSNFSSISLDFSLDIDRFQIDKPLSLFFSDVLPHRIDDDVSNGDFPVTSRNPSDFHNERNFDLVQTDFEFQTNKTRFVEFQEGNGPSVEESDKRKFEIIQFETPELNFFLEDGACPFRDDCKWIGSRVPEVEMSVDPGTAISYPSNVSDSIYLVEDIPMEYQIEHFVEDPGLVQDKTCLSATNYPLLEVNEFNLEFYPSSCMEEELHVLLQTIGLQQWTRKGNQIADVEDIIRPVDIDKLKCLIEPSLSEIYLEPQPALVELVLELDFICLKETPVIKESPLMSLEALDIAFFSVTAPVIFQEIQILDFDSCRTSENFFTSHTVIQPDTCDNIFGEDNYCANLYESMISQELALVDDSFKSLPLPVLSDDKGIFSLFDALEEVLADLKPYPSSASDGIYLDWHLLLEDRWSSDTYSTDWEMVEIDTELISVNDETVIFDFIFSDDTSDKSNTLESTEIITEPVTDGAPVNLLKNESQNFGVRKSETKSEVPSCFESMTTFNQLDFFLNPLKSTVKRNSELEVKETTAMKGEILLHTSSNLLAARASTEVKLHKWDFEVHQVQLSDHMLNMISTLHKAYFEILGSDVLQQNMHCPFQVVDSSKLLNLPQKKLLEWMKYRGSQLSSSVQKDESNMAFVSLCAIKQLAWYLCFYGIHAAHLYVNNLYRRLDYFRLRLSFLLSLIGDARREVDCNMSQSHPSLSVIRRILRSHSSQSASKILIVAEKVFWWPLKRLLNSMCISFHETNNDDMPIQQEDAVVTDKVSKFVMDILRHSDCLLIDHHLAFISTTSKRVTDEYENNSILEICRHISTSFPFQMFGIILEYGGSCGSSKICASPPRSSGLPCLHFLKVELAECSISRSLCEGVDAPIAEFRMEGVHQPMSSEHDSIEYENLEDLLHFVPTEENCANVKSSEPVHNNDTSSLSMPDPNMPFLTEPKEIQKMMSSNPDMIVIVNTQNFDKEMLFSRRSSYQKILAMEKGGIQVIEREMNQPMDLIFSAAMCLVWYDCRNMWKKETDTVDISSCIPLCVENIATNILTSLSFAFTNCILVFEGESRFLTAIMESSDGLYAAAASLGIDLQIFCSYSSELTDEIVQSCMNYALKLNKGHYPKMLDSETLAESFLTRFPSINPLSAHAILSSGGMLVEFLEWSRNQRIQAIGKFNVPDISVEIFSSLCSFGEHEESRSGTTECSSVSSASESNSRLKTDSARKRQKCIIEPPHTLDMPTDDYFLLEALNQFEDVNLKPSSRGPQRNQSWMASKSHQVDDVEMPSLAPNNKLFGQKQNLNTSSRNNLAWNNVYKSENLHDDLKGEVLDLTDNSILDEDFFSADAMNFTVMAPMTGKDHAHGNSKVTRRLSFGLNDFPAFPTSSEINPDSDIWNSSKGQKRTLKDIDSIKDPLSLANEELLFEDKQLYRSTSNTQRTLFPENILQRYGQTPLSNAINSSNIQQGSPWKTEFLKKFREKSKMNKKALLSNATYRYSDGIEKMVKRKSPSILDYYRYQGGSSSKKTPKQIWQRRLIQPSSLSKNEKASASHVQTWTPIDKRAGKTLSFARNGNERQSKLVWSNGEDQHPRKKYRKES